MFLIRSIERESPGIACAPNWESSAPLDLSYELFLLIFGLLIPLAVIMWSYISILVFIRRVSHQQTA